MLVAANHEDKPDKKGEVDSSSGNGEEQYAEAEALATDANDHGCGTEEEQHKKEDELGALSSEDAEEESERSRGKRHESPGKQTTYIMDATLPAVAKEEDKDVAAEEEGDDNHRQRHKIDNEEKPAQIAANRLPLTYHLGNADIEQLLEDAVEDVDRPEDEGQGEGEKTHFGLVEIESHPDEGEVAREAADKLLRHRIEGEIAEFACCPATFCFGDVLRII